jgi:hypothetical protein
MTERLVKPVQLGASFLGQVPVVAVKSGWHAATLVRLIHSQPSALGTAQQGLGRPLRHAEVLGDLARGVSPSKAERLQKREPVRHGSESSWHRSAAVARALLG